MSCYLRHLNDILNEAGITVTPDNRKQVDQAIHRIVGVDYKDCPATWKKLKQQIAGDEPQRKEFIKKLRNSVIQGDGTI